MHIHKFKNILACEDAFGEGVDAGPRPLCAAPAFLVLCPREQARGQRPPRPLLQAPAWSSALASSSDELEV